MLSTSYSEQLMTALTIWRNPQSEEENWVHRRDDFKRFPPVWTIVKCEGAYLLLVAVAVGECAATALFMGMTCTFSKCNDRPFKSSIRWFQNSKVACGWACSNMMNNLTEPNMHTSPGNMRIEEMVQKRKISMRPWEFSFEDPFDGKDD